MNAESESAFDQASLDAGLELWPGSLTLFDPDDNTPTAIASAVVTLSPVTVQLNGSEGGGLVRVRQLSVEIPKADLAAAPAVGAVLNYDVGSETVQFKVDEVHGQNSNDKSWFLRAIEWDQ